MAFPLDLSFPTWVNGQTPGAGDLNKMQNAAIDLANPPSASVTRTDVLLVSSSFTFNGLYWNTVLFETDSTLVPNIGGTTYTDRIYLKYKGLWEIGCTIRTQTNNTFGYGQLQLMLRNGSDNTEFNVDTDTADNDKQRASVLRTHCFVKINQTQVNNQIFVRAEYVQDSGGDNSIRTDYPAYPVMYAVWRGTAGL